MESRIENVPQVTLGEAKKIISALAASQVPRRRYFRPLRRPVGLREGPEEVPPHVPAAMRDRVDLRVAGLDVAGHDFFPGLAFDGIENRPVDAGAPVGLCGEGLHPRQALERAVQGRRAHRKYRGHVLPWLYQRDAFLVFAHDARQLGDEVGRAGTADGFPEPPGVRERVVGVGLAPAFSFLVADVSRQKLDDVLAGISHGLADRVENAGAFGTSGSRVGAALFCDVFGD